jgi:prophage regulatory protein
MATTIGNTPKILRRKQVQSITGLSRSTIYAEIKAGRFPGQVQLTSKRSVGWLESEVVAFIQGRVDASRNLVQGGM